MLLIGIAGGTCSGKTTLASVVRQNFRDVSVVIPEDMYYRDRGQLPLAQRHQINFDHPDAFDTACLITHLKTLQAGKPIQMPQYGFATHTRKKRSKRINPCPIVITEGIMVMHDESLRELFDLKIFMEAAADVRFIRRLQRDTKERGRTVDSVIKQYYESVRPMHAKFIEPTKQYADLVITTDKPDELAITRLLARLQSLSDNLDFQ